MGFINKKRKLIPNKALFFVAFLQAQCGSVDGKVYHCMSLKT